MYISYGKRYEKLESVASRFWLPSSLGTERSRDSVPLLLRTQDQFITIIGVATPSLENLFRVIEACTLPANLFVKHLTILADFGGEALQSVSNWFEVLFPSGELIYSWGDEQRVYKFAALPYQELSEQALAINNEELLTPHPLNALQRDAIALLLFGSRYGGVAHELGIALNRCRIGECLGKPILISTIAKQRYIWLSQFA